MSRADMTDQQLDDQQAVMVQAAVKQAVIESNTNCAEEIRQYRCRIDGLVAALEIERQGRLETEAALRLAKANCRRLGEEKDAIRLQANQLRDRVTYFMNTISSRTATDGTAEIIQAAQA